ncbi:hypothetical protein Tco_1302907 [Tanacetum coccineum]
MAASGVRREVHSGEEIVARREGSGGELPWRLWELGVWGTRGSGLCAWERSILLGLGVETAETGGGWLLRMSWGWADWAVAVMGAADLVGGLVRSVLEWRSGVLGRCSVGDLLGGALGGLTARGGGAGAFPSDEYWRGGVLGMRGGQSCSLPAGALPYRAPSLYTSVISNTFTSSFVLLTSLMFPYRLRASWALFVAVVGLWEEEEFGKQNRVAGWGFGIGGNKIGETGLYCLGQLYVDKGG